MTHDQHRPDAACARESARDCACEGVGAAEPAGAAPLAAGLQGAVTLSSDRFVHRPPQQARPSAIVMPFQRRRRNAQ